MEYQNQTLKQYTEDFLLNMDTEEGVHALLESEGFRVVEFYGSYKIPTHPDRPGFVVGASRRP